MRLPRRAARPSAHADGDDVPGESPRPERLPRRWRTSEMPRAGSRSCPVSRTARAPPGTMARSSSTARVPTTRLPTASQSPTSASSLVPSATPSGAIPAMVSRLYRKRSFATHRDPHSVGGLTPPASAVIPKQLGTS